MYILILFIILDKQLFIYFYLSTNSFNNDGICPFKNSKQLTFIYINIKQMYPLISML